MRSYAASLQNPDFGLWAGVPGISRTFTASFSAHEPPTSKPTYGTCACCGSSLTTLVTRNRAQAPLSSGRVIDLAFKNPDIHGAVVFGLLTPEMESQR